MGAAQKKVKAKPPCRHCGGRANRPRGLCWTCYNTPGIRERYQSLSRYGKWGQGAITTGRLTMPEPTDTLPGTAAKLAVLMARASASQLLWHPRDANGDGDRPLVKKRKAKITAGPVSPSAGRDRQEVREVDREE